MIPKTDDQSIERAYAEARERYAAYGVDTDRAIQRLADIAISLHCWQGDDVGGFDSDRELSGGILSTGNYPGKARTADELRGDLDKTLALIPGTHRLNLHAMYAETGGAVDRNALQPEHFASWIDWARGHGIGMDFNGSFFSHPKADEGFTLASNDAGIRQFWIEHAIACRKIGEHMGRELGSVSINNLWIPDGLKDMPADRKAPRERLRESLDTIFAEKIDPTVYRDAIESKLFGIGSESYVVGSFEFYYGYAVANELILCLDAGHFHPTEVISDKISSVLLYIDELLLHVSRGVRWDSDHVVLLTDELRAIGEELVRGEFLDRVHVGLDFFDASINRLAAWTIGTRATLKSLLLALLEPRAQLMEFEASGDFTSRLALLEELKQLPQGAVWDYHCRAQDVPAGLDWLDEIKQYEKDVLSARD
jgi:L-rhamnose isomerase